MFITPKLEECLDFAKNMGCNELVQVSIEPREFDLPYRCHDNCSYNPVLGYYFIKDYNTNILYAYKHSVLNLGEKLIDVTPTFDNRTYNIFGYGPDLKYSFESIMYLENQVFINKEKLGDQDMYYVYGLIDSRTNLPFYIGKGKGDRWKYHYSNKCFEKEISTKKVDMIKELKSLGYEPSVIFYAQNIDDEHIAYDIEASLIKKYGRKYYEENGILTNITIDSRPPNWKDKTYEEIYGYKKGKEIKEYKAKQQRARGGYFKGQKHTEESKRKIGVASAAQALTEEIVLEYGKNFCDFFNGQISRTKWNWWTKNNNIQTNILKQGIRFSGRYALEVFVERFNANLITSPLLWFHHPETKETFRCQDWELEHKVKIVPKGFIKGRGISTFGDNKGFIIVSDKEKNTTTRMKKDDPRYISGEYISVNKDYVIVEDNNHKLFRVKKNDPRYISGELVFKNPAKG
jgi:hypothetical protein